MKRAQEILDASEDCENLTADDIIVHVGGVPTASYVVLLLPPSLLLSLDHQEVPFDYGHKGHNPIESMYFYDKDEPRKIPEEEVLHMLPRGFSWKLVRVYCKKLNSSDKAQK